MKKRRAFLKFVAAASAAGVTGLRPAERTVTYSPSVPWISQQIWPGESLPGDHALRAKEALECPNLQR